MIVQIRKQQLTLWNKRRLPAVAASPGIGGALERAALVCLQHGCAMSAPPSKGRDTDKLVLWQRASEIEACGGSSKGCLAWQCLLPSDLGHNDIRGIGGAHERPIQRRHPRTANAPHRNADGLRSHLRRLHVDFCRNQPASAGTAAVADARGHSLLLRCEAVRFSVVRRPYSATRQEGTR